MENRKNYIEKHVRNRCSKLRQALQDVVIRGNTKEIGHGNLQKKFQDKCTNNTTKKTQRKCKEIQVTETYDEVLDMRNILPKESSKDDNKFINNKTSDAEQIFLDKVCEFPNMHYKIMNLCAVKNSSKFSEQFNTKTEIISERIVTKQLELQATERSPQRSKPVHKIPPKNGDKIVVQKIIQKENELKKRKTKKVQTDIKSKSDTKLSDRNIKSISDAKSDISKASTTKSKKQVSRPRFILSTKPETKRPSFNKVPHSLVLLKPRCLKSSTAGMNGISTSKTVIPNSLNSFDSVQMNSIILDKSKSNMSGAASREVGVATSYINSTRPKPKPTKKKTVSHSFVQVTMAKPSSCVCTQTEKNQLKNMPVQTYKKKAVNAKKIQTRLCKKYTAETSPIETQSPAKYTSTACDFCRSEQQTQMYEHFTINDLVCLDWVNKHLFGVSVNPHNVIVDEKIKEVSELASKSTFLSEVESLALPY